jgi:hypothetical protein
MRKSKDPIRGSGLCNEKVFHNASPAFEGRARRFAASPGIQAGALIEKCPATSPWRVTARRLHRQFRHRSLWFLRCLMRSFRALLPHVGIQILLLHWFSTLRAEYPSCGTLLRTVMGSRSECGGHRYILLRWLLSQSAQCGTQRPWIREQMMHRENAKERSEAYFPGNNASNDAQNLRAIALYR